MVYPIFKIKFCYIPVTDEASTFKIEKRWNLPRPIIKSHQKKKWVWPWARGAPKILEFDFNISATAEASDFKFGVQLGFAKGRHKITP